MERALETGFRKVTSITAANDSKEAKEVEDIDFHGLLQVVPFVDKAHARSANLVEAFFIVNHVGALGAGDDVVGAEIYGLFGTDFLAHAAVDAADHIDFKFLGALFHLGPFVIGWDFGGNNLDGLRRADEFAKLTGDTALTLLLIGDERRNTTVVFREMRRPIFARDTAS